MIDSICFFDNLTIQEAKEMEINEQRDLIVVDDEILRCRYNDCLRDMGLPETQLEIFRIDRMGWSPEIALEMKNSLYNSHGEANPVAIILTPDQRFAPIAFGYHSFDYAMLEMWFDKYLDQITELTTRCGIWLDIDQDVAVFKDPEDLLMVTEVNVRANTPDHIMSKAAKQTHYVRNIIRADDMPNIEKNAILLCDSVNDIGDMRGKDINITDMRFPVGCTYYTRAFGGTFILCNDYVDGDALIFNKKVVANHDGVASPIDQSVIHSLEQLGLISYDLAWWGQNIPRIRMVRESILMEVFDEAFPDLDISKINAAERKKLINQVKDQLPEEYCLLSHLIHRLEEGHFDIEIDENIRPYLAFPAKHLDEWVRNVLWHLLVLVCDGRQVDCFYVFDRDEFFNNYKTWKMPRKTWAQSIIK